MNSGPGSKNRLSVSISPDYCEVRHGHVDIDIHTAEAQEAIRSLMALSEESEPNERREQLQHLIGVGERLKQMVHSAEMRAIEEGGGKSAVRAAANKVIVEAVEQEILHGPYRRAYRTENGSVYLETPAGCTLRIKGQDTVGVRVQPACARTYFLDDDTAELFLQTRKEGINGEELIGRPFGHVPFGLGVHPIEFDPACTFDRTLLTVGSDRFVIEGMVNGTSVSNTCAGVNHVGHVVTEILRSEDTDR